MKNEEILVDVLSRIELELHAIHKELERIANKEDRRNKI